MSRYVKDSNGDWHLSAGMPQIDDELDATSENPVQNKAIVEGISPMLNVLGAKNLLPNNAVTQTLNGITFTVNSDKSVTVSGTATANTYYQLSWVKNISLEVGKSYVISGCPNGSSDNSYYIYMNVNGETIKAYDEEVSFTFSSYVTDSEVAIKIANGAVISTPITIYPMIRPASIVDDTYVPYAMTNRELTDLTKNKIGDPHALSTSDYVAPSDGYVTANVQYARGRYIHVSVNGITLIQICTPSDASAYANAVMASYQSASLFVKKGMVLKIVNKSSYGDEYAMFRPII